MSYRRLFVVLLALLGGASFACTVSADSARPVDAGAAGSGGSGGSTPSASGGTTAAAGPEEAMPPGRYVIDPLTPGENACAGTTLGAVLNSLRAAYPELADITTIYNPARMAVGDGSFVYPYQKTGGGFAIALKRGLGDCPAGCTENFYYYFETDPMCVVAQVGRYHATWGDGSCLNVEGTPRWSHPPAPNPSLICGADNRALDQRGTYSFAGVGQSQACVLNADRPTVNAVNVTVAVTIAQDADDLSTGTITLTGTGHALVDGVPLPAKFSRQRFEADQQISNLPNICPREHGVMVHYDFESAQPGFLMLSEFGSDSCAPCKGFMHLMLVRDL